MNLFLHVLGVVGGIAVIAWLLFGEQVMRHHHTYPAAPSPVAVPAALDPFQAMVERAWLEAVEQARALAEVGGGWLIPSRAQVEKDLIERGIADLAAWANEHSTRQDGAP